MYIFLLKSFLCLLVLLSFYKIFLENEKAHLFNRFFLIGSLILSVILPLISISYTTDIPLTNEIIQPGENARFPLANPNGPTPFDSFISYLLPYIIGFIYSFGIIFFGYRFFRNLRNLQFKIEHNQKLAEQSYILVLLKTKLNPHTFLNYIFLNKKEYEERKIAREVLLHEKAHVDQKHTIDLLIIEFLQIIFWVNPLFIWLKKAAKLNHEFLADQKVISEVKNVSEYSNILFQYAGGSHQVSLSSSINYSLTKKRIIMISKSFSIKKLLIKLGLFIPILGCCIFFFTDEIVAKPVLIPSETSVASEELYPQINDSFQQDHFINIKIEEEKLWVNGKLTNIKNFSKSIDELTADWTDDEINDANLNIQTQNSDKEFMEKLNKEFKKTRFSMITGHDILPPPPPMPPSAKQIPPPPPTAPHYDKSEKTPPAPPAPPAPHMQHKLPHLPSHIRKDSLREMAREGRVKIRQEMERVRDLEKQYAAKREISDEERRKFPEDIQRKRENAQAKREEIQQQREETEKRHEVIRKEHERIAKEKIARIDSIKKSNNN